MNKHGAQNTGKTIKRILFVYEGIQIQIYLCIDMYIAECRCKRCRLYVYRYTYRRLYNTAFGQYKPCIHGLA